MLSPIQDAALTARSLKVLRERDTASHDVPLSALEFLTEKLIEQVLALEKTDASDS